MGNAIAVGGGTFLAGTVSGESDVLGITVDADIEGTPFVAKLTESGTAPFAAYTRGAFEATVTERYATSAGSAEDIARTSDGTLSVAGLFYGSIDVGSGPVESPSTSGFVLRIPPP
ncbi:hypothetical protein [Sorangium sp. So ce128]|uniref:hypothetical protein n=1 Tax=Sorangium sp. So ce128 TaxID=3133281 RepID=UPI003F628E2D